MSAPSTPPAVLSPTTLPPTVFVLFGATGDLSRRMVLPAFFALAQHDLLPARWVLVGNGRGEVSDAEFRSHVHDALSEGPPLPDGAWERFAPHLRFAGHGFGPDDPGTLLDVLSEAEDEVGRQPQLVYYLALPPSAFEQVTEGLGRYGLTDRARVVYEKPFGTSPESFRRLDAAVHAVLDEQQVFRIDHFLGKEGTQDLYALRFANGLFEHAWTRQHVREVQIDVPERLDIADRAQFYDSTGALLDMVVSHLFQIAAEVAMEPPASLSASDLVAAREAVLTSFRPLAVDEVVLGQFEGYRDTVGVAPDSATDTFVAARLWVDTDRWRGVPFLLRTGKQLAVDEQLVSLVFRDPDSGPLRQGLPPLGNVLSLSLAGDGALRLRVVVKEPGLSFQLATAQADLPLSRVPGADPLPPYAKLLHDVLVGDRSLFTRPDGLAATWQVVGPLLDHRPALHPYARGSWGPVAASALAGPDGWLLGDPAGPAGAAAVAAGDPDQTASASGAVR